MANGDSLTAKIPLDALDDFVAHIGGIPGMPAGTPGKTATMAMPQPTAPASSTPADMPAPNISSAPLGQIPTFASPTPAQPKQSTLGKIGHVLGEIGEYGLSAVAPHVAEMIPQTPLGRIAQHERELGEEKQRSEEEINRTRAGAEATTAGAEKTKADVAQENANLVPVTTRDGRTAYLRQEDVGKFLGTEETAETRFDIEKSKETAAQMLQNGRPVTMDQLAARATKENDQQTLEQIEDYKKQIAAAGKQEPGNFIPVNDAQGNTLGWADPKSRDWVPVSAVGGAGNAAGAGGVIPPKPTATTLQMGQQGAAVSEQIPGIIKEIQDLSASIGPAVGRWNQLLVNKGGTDFPQFAGLDEDLQLAASGLARAHFGARGAASATSDFKKYLTEAQSPDDLIARLQHADGWMEGYARHAGIKTGGEGGGKIPDGAVPGTMNGKHGYVLNGEFHAD